MSHRSIQYGRARMSTWTSEPFGVFSNKAYPNLKALIHPVSLFPNVSRCVLLSNATVLGTWDSIYIGRSSVYCSTLSWEFPYHLNGPWWLYLHSVFWKMLVGGSGIFSCLFFFFSFWDFPAFLSILGMEVSSSIIHNIVFSPPFERTPIIFLSRN